MNIKFLENFRLINEKEDFNVVLTIIKKEAIFKGPNLWILFFATLIASLGLNLNSTAVIIGAMLISPLMGPILGVGVGAAINDLPLIKTSFYNYLLSAAIGLTASTLYFLISPITDAHSEILSRTNPSIYDVLIAFFGGFAGIIALSTKYKGNVISGVAIATALMPPLCTAGYGLATWQLNYFIGAFYLYLINSVFIASATIILGYLLKFPKKKYEHPENEKKVILIIWLITLLALIPSVYSGFMIVEEYNYNKNANEYITAEANFTNDYLLRKKIDSKNKIITLTFGGKEITSSKINILKKKLKNYNLKNTTLEIKQGFTFLNDKNQINFLLNKNEKQLDTFSKKLDSIRFNRMLSKQIYKELKVQYPEIQSAIIELVPINQDIQEQEKMVYLILINFEKEINKEEKNKIEKWLKLRLNTQNIQFVFRSDF